MAAEANLGRWEAREVDPLFVGDRAAVRPEPTGPDPSPFDAGDAGDGGEPDPPAADRHGPDDDATDPGSSFWLGVLVGLIPLVLLVGSVVGYRLISDDGDGSEGVGLLAGDAPNPTTATAVPTTPTPTSAVVTEPPPPPVAAGVVADGVVEVGGTLPPAFRDQWLGELGDLADVFGYRLLDRTRSSTATADGATGASSELVVRFPGAVVFRSDIPQNFEGDPTPTVEAVAGVLNRGSAQLTIIGYAEPDAPGDALIALARAEHLREHIAELGVDPSRLTVEARPPSQAPPGGGGGAPIDRRADLEFRFGS